MSKSPIANTIFGSLLFAWLFLAVFPFLWMFIISFRLPVDAFSEPLKLFTTFTFEHYYKTWVEDAFWVKGVNTLLVTVGTVSVSMTVACLAGYALSRYQGSAGFLAINCSTSIPCNATCRSINIIPTCIFRIRDLEPL